ncbi:CPBP family intramembrane glutamic endopeptidase [Zavarzinella formosa]|uniref:CPBP family intramembrane glutamic endopeptidase n=1 Tax=Zavarzinella formosa TaxID=360055 RepID=UPI00037D2A75|nr:type II CAAX endopeptidase family protein [Zavarzinella formosa]
MNEAPLNLPAPIPTSSRRTGFGAWMAFAWCLAYMFVMQILAGLACGGPLIIGAALLDKRNFNGDAKELMSSSLAQIAIMLTLICSHLVGLAFGWFILRWRVGKSWKRRIAWSRGPAGLHIALVLIGFPALMALASFVDPLVSRWVPSLDDIFKSIGFDFKFGGLDEMLTLFKATPLPLALLAVAVLPALNEELWCRGFLGQGLSARYAVWPTVLVTSFLFGFLHMEPRQGTGAAMLGVAIHFAYLATRSWWVAVALHFANNGLAVIHLNEKLNFPILKPFEEMAERSLAAISEGSVPYFLLGSLALFGSVAFALWQTRCKLETIDPTAVPWKPKTKSGVDLPPADSGVAVTHESLSPISISLVLAGAVIFGLTTLV